MVYKVFDKISTSSGINSISNQQLPDELRKPIMKNLKEERFIHHLKTIFGELILLIWN